MVTLLACLFLEEQRKNFPNLVKPESKVIAWLLQTIRFSVVIPNVFVASGVYLKIDPLN